MQMKEPNSTKIPYPHKWNVTSSVENMISDYEKVLDEIAQRLTPGTHGTAVALAALPDEIKGFGHVKHANYEAAKKREAALLAMLRDPKPAPIRVAAE